MKRRTALAFVALWLAAELPALADVQTAIRVQIGRRQRHHRLCTAATCARVSWRSMLLVGANLRYGITERVTFRWDAGRRAIASAPGDLSRRMAHGTLENSVAVPLGRAYQIDLREVVGYIVAHPDDPPAWNVDVLYTVLPATL